MGPAELACVSIKNFVLKRIGARLPDPSFLSALIATESQACPSGTFSQAFSDDSGETFVCVPCAAGTSQPSGASLSCKPCKQGGGYPETTLAFLRRGKASTRTRWAPVRASVARSASTRSTKMEQA